MAFSENFYEARAKALSNKTTNQRGNEKAIIARDWVYRWKYSSASVLDKSGGAKRRGLSARLVKSGDFKATKTACGNGFKDVPGHILTLTEEGLRLVERHREHLIRYEVDPYRVRQDQLRHYQIAQSLTMDALNESKILDFQTESELSDMSLANVKQPDVIWTLQNNKKIGLEIELTAKWDRKLDQFILSCLTALSSGQLDYIAIYSDSSALIKRYKQAFKPGELYSKWIKNERGFWVEQEKCKVPEWVEGKVICRAFSK